MKKIFFAFLLIMSFVAVISSTVNAQPFSTPTLGMRNGGNPWYTGTSTTSVDTTAYNTTDTTVVKFSDDKVHSLSFQVDIIRIGATALSSASTVKLYGSLDLGVSYVLLTTFQLANATGQSFSYVLYGNPYTHYMIVHACADSAASFKFKDWLLARR